MKLKELADEVAEGLGYEVDNLELLGSGGRRLLRVTIDSKNGVTLDDCTVFSRDLSALLDVEDPIDGPYTLEVSSPGLDRPLKEERDFVKCVGKLARVVTREKVLEANTVTGTILSAGDGRVRLEVDGREVEIEMENITRARLEVRI